MALKTLREREMFKFASKDKIILQGDFNAICSNLQDAVTFSNYFTKNNDIIDIMIQISPAKTAQTVSNTRGKKSIDMCIMNDLNIVNGRKNGEKNFRKKKLVLCGMVAI